MIEKISLTDYLLKRVPAWVLNPQTPEAVADEWWKETEKQYKKEFGRDSKSGQDSTEDRFYTIDGRK